MNESDTVLAPVENATSVAIVQGQALSHLPKDLYIPPDAMKVFLEAFEGPLDLLLYLIKKQNLNILEVSLAEVTRQYVEYVELMKAISLELAAEYLVMAALLAEIKSRMLLPRPENTETDENDPRAELVRRLQEYERFKKAAADLDQVPRKGRDTFVASAQLTEKIAQVAKPTVSLKDILFAFADVLHRVELTAHHQIQKEPLSVSERMARIVSALKEKEFVTFASLFVVSEGRLGVVVTFLAMLELLKDNIIEFIQTTPFGPIHLKAIE